MSIILISFVLVMKFTNSFLVSCRAIIYKIYILIGSLGAFQAELS